MALGETAAWIGLAIICMLGNLAGGYWLGRDFFGHDSDTPFRTRLAAHALLTTGLVILLFLSQTD